MKTKNDNCPSEPKYVASGIPVWCCFSEILDPSSLKPDPDNYNIHPDAQLKVLADSIRQHGWQKPIVMDGKSGYIVTGHGECMAAIKMGLKMVPVDVRWYDNDESRYAWMIADNKTAKMSKEDDEILTRLLKGMDQAKLSIPAVGVSDAEWSALLGALEAGTEHDVVIDPTEELLKKWGVEVGQLWEVGCHRLVCGDSTDKETVEMLLGGVTPQMMVTDPPYGVEYDASWRVKRGVCAGGGSRQGKVLNDDKADWTEAWKLFGGDLAYVYHASISTDVVKASLESVGLKARNLIVWDKERIVIGRGDYHHAMETAWYCVREGKPGLRNDDRTQGSVWRIPMIEGKGLGHSTQKPVECMQRPMRNHTIKTVYEPFCGSGTTMVAAQLILKTCFAIELNPNYCAVILERMQATFPAIEIKKAEKRTTT